MLCSASGWSRPAQLQPHRRRLQPPTVQTGQSGGGWATTQLRTLQDPRSRSRRSPQRSQTARRRPSWQARASAAARSLALHLGSSQRQSLVPKHMRTAQQLDSPPASRSAAGRRRCRHASSLARACPRPWATSPCAWSSSAPIPPIMHGACTALHALLMPGLELPYRYTLHAWRPSAVVSERDLAWVRPAGPQGATTATQSTTCGAS